MGSVGLSDHLMLTALVSDVFRQLLFAALLTWILQLITWGNTVINYYQYQFSQASRPSQLRGPVSNQMPRRSSLVTAKPSQG